MFYSGFVLTHECEGSLFDLLEMDKFKVYSRHFKLSKDLNWYSYFCLLS